MKIILLGFTGYVGSWVKKYFGEQGYEVSAERIDVMDVVALRNGVSSIVAQDPSVTRSVTSPLVRGEPYDRSEMVVINATGKTGRPNVDWCEENKEETYRVNVQGAVNVADVCREFGIYMVQIGSGCIFDSFGSQIPISKFQIPNKSQISNPKIQTDWEAVLEQEGVRVFSEDDEPNFFGSFYSQTKAMCESVLREYENVCTLRIRMPLSAEPNDRNLLNKILKYHQIVSVPNSVTIMEHFMPFLEQVCLQRVCGVLNAVNPGRYEHKDLLELYREVVDFSKSFEYIGLEAFEGMTKAARSNCVLSTARCRELGIEMPRVEESLLALVKGYGGLA